MRPYALLLYYFIIRTTDAYRQPVDVKSYKECKKTNGFDHRNEPDSKQDVLQLYKIAKIFERKKLVDYLQNPSVNIHMKMRTIEDRGVTPENIFAGGLMTDFDFPPLDE